jgi:hypothetical protein
VKDIVKEFDDNPAKDEIQEEEKAEEKEISIV